MKKIGTVNDIEREIQTVLAGTLPPAELITAAIGLIFEGDKLLMTRLRERDWDLPGGHIEPGETPEEAVKREIHEETAARVRNLRVFGHMKISIHGPKPEGFAYPYPSGYMVFYMGELLSLDAFSATDEATDRELFAPDDVRRTQWGKQDAFAVLYEAALEERAKSEGRQ